MIYLYFLYSCTLFNKDSALNNTPYCLQRMFYAARQTARSVLFASRLSAGARRNLSARRAPPTSQGYVPLITVSACAITSASMYYYFTSKIKNESEEKNLENALETPVDVDVVEVIEVEDPEKGTNASPEMVEVIETVVLNKPEVVDAVESTEELVEVVQEAADVAQDVIDSIPAEEALEEEAQQQGAFNEETGEINWDCPCLGGMAHGPCGEDFKAAFSCFVYSKEEPKGIECIEKFKAMQDCFRRYPDVYSEELRDEEVVSNNVREKKQSKLDIDIYGAAQKKIDDFNKK